MWTLYSLIVALFSPLYLYSDDLEIVLFAVCMSLHEPFLVWKVVNGQHVSVTMLKVKVYFRGRSCTWISLSLHRGGGGGGWIQIKKKGHCCGGKWQSSDRSWSCEIYCLCEGLSVLHSSVLQIRWTTPRETLFFYLKNGKTKPSCRFPLIFLFSWICNSFRNT